MIHESAFKIVITWGKYKGSTLGHIALLNPSYLDWLSQQPTVSEMWRNAAKATINGEPVIDPQLPTVKLSKSGVITTASPVVMPTAEVDMVNDTFVYVKFQYNENIIKRIKEEIDGRKWNDKKKQWEIPLIRLPELMQIFGGITNVNCTEQVKAAYVAEMQRKTDLNSIRVQDDYDIDIPGLKIPLYPYQRVGVKFIDRAGGRGLIADEMGLGKTAMGIGFALLHNCKTLIICPPAVEINWERQIAKFTGQNTTRWNTQKILGFMDNQFHVIGYSAVQKQLNNILKQKFDLLICDEATYLKNRKTIRTKSIMGYYKERKKYPGIQTKYAIFLTGTPVLNRPIEAFTLLNFLSKERFNNFMHFVQRYGGWQNEPPKNLKELHERTHDVVIRRLTRDVQKELPPKQRNDLYFELTPEQYVEYDKLLRKLFHSWHSEGRPSVAHMPAIQEYLATIKLPPLYDFIDELLENNKSLLVYSCYKQPLREIQKKYGDKVRMLNGDMNLNDRQKTIDDLSSGRAPIGCFTIGVGKMGIDGLQEKVDTVIFLDQDWVPANHEQAEARAHRNGQKNVVQIYYMVCTNTIDEYMRQVLSEKQRIIDEIVDGELVTTARTKNFFGEILKIMKSRLPNYDFNL